MRRRVIRRLWSGHAFGLSFRENITSFWYYYQSLGGVSLFSVFWLGDESL